MKEILNNGQKVVEFRIPCKHTIWLPWKPINKNKHVVYSPFEFLEVLTQSISRSSQIDYVKLIEESDAALKQINVSLKKLSQNFCRSFLLEIILLTIIQNFLLTLWRRFDMSLNYSSIMHLRLMGKWNWGEAMNRTLRNLNCSICQDKTEP